MDEYEMFDLLLDREYMKQLNSINEAIEKWQKVLFKGAEECGASDCSCCQKWVNKNCIGCPILELTGEAGCIMTPYTNWCCLFKEEFKMRKGKYANTKERKTAATEELVFLYELQRSLVCSIYHNWKGRY